MIAASNLAVLASLALVGWMVRLVCRRYEQVGPSSDHGTRLYLNDGSPARLDSNGAPSSISLRSER